MSSGQLNIFGEDVYEYFFLIQPDQKTEKEVKLYKRIVNGYIHLSAENRWSVPHLSLFKCTANCSMDEAIISKASQALKNVEGFKVKLDGVDVYHHGLIKKSLVLKVKNPAPIKSLNKSLSEEFKGPSDKLSPHITIVRAIPTNDFKKLNSLEQFNYKGEFDCKKVTILKKMVGSDKNYVVLHEAALC
jgi:2'-5' RNA ligase